MTSSQHQLLDSLQQPCLIIGTESHDIIFVNRSFLATLGLTSRKFSRNFKYLEDLFPENLIIFLQAIKEARKTGEEANGEEFVEKIQNLDYVLVPRVVPFDEDSLLILLNNLTVEKRLQDKYSMVQKSLTAYAQKMHADLEFKDYLVNRIPSVLSSEILSISRHLLELKQELKSSRSGISQNLKLIAGSIDQLSYLSKNISQLSAPYFVDRKSFTVEELGKALASTFHRSQDYLLSTLLIEYSQTKADSPFMVDPNLVGFSIRNLLRFLDARIDYTGKEGRVKLRTQNRNGKIILHIEGNLGQLPNRRSSSPGDKDLGLELIVASKLIRTMGGILSFSSSPENSFRISLPGMTNFVLHRQKPLYDKIYFYGSASDMPRGLADFFTTENIDYELISRPEAIRKDVKSAVILGKFNKQIAEHMKNHPNNEASFIPIVRSESFDFIVNILSGVPMEKFLFEPLTVDGLRSVFFSNNQSDEFVIEKI